jgi:CRISPR-associated endonuclease Cas3-HD
LARPGQLLSEHSTNVSEYAAEFGSKFGAGELMRIAGAYHDIGKSLPEFQVYVRDENGKRGSVYHSIFGAKKAYDNSGSFVAAADILSNIIASPHGSLRDYITPDGSRPLWDKLQETNDFSPRAECPEIDSTILKNELRSILSAVPQNEKAFGYTLRNVVVAAECIGFMR